MQSASPHSPAVARFCPPGGYLVPASRQRSCDIQSAVFAELNSPSPPQCHPGRRGGFGGFELPLSLRCPFVASRRDRCACLRHHRRAIDDARCTVDSGSSKGSADASPLLVLALISVSAVHLHPPPAPRGSGTGAIAGNETEHLRGANGLRAAPPRDPAPDLGLRTSYTTTIQGNLVVFWSPAHVAGICSHHPPRQAPRLLLRADRSGGNFLFFQTRATSGICLNTLKAQLTVELHLSRGCELVVMVLFCPWFTGPLHPSAEKIVTGPALARSLGWGPAHWTGAFLGSEPDAQKQQGQGTARGGAPALDWSMVVAGNWKSPINVS